MKTLYLVFVLGLMVILAQPVRSSTCPDTNTPPNRGIVDSKYPNITKE